MGDRVDFNHILVELSPIEYSKKRSRHDEGNYEEIKDKNRRLSQVDQTSYSGLEDNDADALLEGELHLDQFGLVAVSLLSDRLVWQQANTEDKLEIGIMCCLGSEATSDTPTQLAISEIYAVEPLSMGVVRQCGTPVPLCCLNGVISQAVQMNRFMVHSFQRSASHKGTWIPITYIFGHPNSDVCRKWAQEIGCLLEQDIKRPRNLLVIISPYSGKKKAAKIWEKVAPLFNCAGVNTQVLTTERARHAFDIMEKATDEDLQTLDGVITVGGDGLFNEVLNGLVLRRHKVKCPPKPQEIASLVGKDCDFMNESKDHGFRLNERRNELLVSHSEMKAKLDLVSLPAAADLHPFLEDPSDPMSESSNLFKYSAVSGYESVFGSESSGHEAVQASDFSESIITPATSGYVSSYPVRYEDGGFIVPSLAGAWFKTAADTETKRGSTGLQLPNPHFRLGIIPAGSTDSIAVSTTGLRDPITSALHIILGDSIAVDVVRLTGWKAKSNSIKEEPRFRYAVTFAGYGFYGDVIKESEVHRWMGPLRYDYAGTKVFMKHKSYEAEVSYLEIPDSMMNPLSTPEFVDIDITTRTKQVKTPGKKSCCVNCTVCAKGFDYSDLDEISVSTHPFSKTPRWQSLSGKFLSIGAAVVSCRNDKAPDGVAAHAHLADGLLDLILIKDCSRPAYLWHLLNLTRKGANPLDFSFIEHHKTPMFTFSSYGKESIWNVDGELFPAHQMSAQVFRGLINIFARGPET